MSRPMMFSAAYSARFEEARRQSQEQERPKLMWRRGFHSEGGRAGWGYYLEPAPSAGPSSVDEQAADGEEMEGVGDGDHRHTNGHEDSVGHAKRPSPSLTGNPALRTGVIASHGVLPPAVSPLALIHHQGRRIARELARR
ncbi:hypothetical protein K466DRAFT_642876, partial [Polyporus arcularius HHB13444]